MISFPEVDTSFPRTRRRPPAPTQIVAVDCPGTTLAAAPVLKQRTKLVCRREAKTSPPRPGSSFARATSISPAGHQRLLSAESSTRDASLLCNGLPTHSAT
jgi:hypothetical protein